MGTSPPISRATHCVRETTIGQPDLKALAAAWLEDRATPLVPLLILHPESTPRANETQSSTLIPYVNVIIQSLRGHRNGNRQGDAEDLCLNVTTRHAIDAFLLECRSRNLSESTLAAYDWSLGKLAAAYPELPTSVEPLIELLASQVLASESRYDLWRVLRTFYTWAAIRYDTPNAMAEIRRPQRDQLLPRTLEEYEIRDLISTIDDQRDLAMVMLILDTGIRLAEVAGLRWSHIRGNRVLILRGKGGNQRYVFIRPETIRVLEGLGDDIHIWVSSQPGRRYGSPLTRSGVQQAIKRILRKAGIHPPKAGPHLLRHTYGRHFIRRGGGVTHLQRIMGHAEVSTTMIYVQLNDADIEEQQFDFSPIAGLFDAEESDENSDEGRQPDDR